MAADHADGRRAVLARPGHVCICCSVVADLQSEFSRDFAHQLMRCLFAIAIARSGHAAHVFAHRTQSVENIARKIRLTVDEGGEFRCHNIFL